MRIAACFVAVALLLGGSLSILFAAEPDPAQAAKDRAIVETLLRLKGVDVNSSPNWKAAVTRHLETVKGTPRYLDLVEKLKLRGVEDELFRLAMEDPASTVGAKAATLLFRANQGSRLEKAANDPDEAIALKAITALSAVGDDQVLEMLKPLVTSDRGGPVQIAAAAALGRNLHGQRYLLELARTDKLPADAKFTAANVLLGSTDESIRQEAAKYLSLPASASSEPLPPISEMTKIKGDAARGKQIFQTTGTCVKCHKVHGEGKEVGPDLSEIGTKLAPDALFTSILDPSAGISHNYDSYVAVTASGTVLTGLMVSRTEQSVTIRTAEAIDREIPSNEIDDLQKSRVSLMPADLQKLMSVQDLVDVVAYLQTLKKK